MANEARLRILVVDDDDLVRMTMEAALAQAGHEVTPASDGNDALRLFQAGRYDLVITDIIMPGREGIETILELRRLSASVPIIAISGGGRTHNLDFLSAAKALGANHALAKPFTPDALLAMVATATAGN
ncbi:MAG: response regulator [Alphaproteobacteria bacterium]|nr:response regulator [Alphaproteobacteria bacterium]